MFRGISSPVARQTYLGILVTGGQIIFNRFNQFPQVLKTPVRDAVVGDICSSIRFIQELLVGVKCMWKRGCVFNHAFTLTCL